MPARSRKRSSAARPPARAHRADRGYDPGRERRAEQRARELLRSCVNEEEWAMYRDLGFIRVWGAGQADRPGARRRRRRRWRALRLPHLSRTSRSSPTCPQTGRAAERVLRRVPRRDAALRQRAAARLRRRAGQVDGADRRRAAADRRRQHAPARPPGRPAQVRRDLWRLRQWERERDAPRAAGATLRAVQCPPRERPTTGFDLKHRSRALTEGPERAAARAYLHGHRLRRRGPRASRSSASLTVDRDDAVQLPPPRARREGQGGHPRGRRHADGAQHDRDLRRDHDGHRAG